MPAEYKGITIKFGADATTISKAMKSIDNEARQLKSNLATVNKSLKFDSDNPELLAQRFVILNEQISNTKNRLAQLVEYEKQAKTLFENGEISKSQFTSLSREIEKAKTELQSLNSEAKASFDTLKTSILGAKDKLSEFTKAAIAAGTALAVNKLKDLGSQAIETASDLREVQNVVDTSFGDLAYMMEDLADKAIEVYGISKLTAKQTGSTFMAMARGMDIVPQTAAEMSIALTALSADMASFYNTEQQVASTALNSVFTGETETLKKFGIVMTEANLNAFAMAQGIEKTVKQMSQAEKVQLRYNYVMSQTSLVQGDFAKTSGEWANRSRVLKEQITELSAMVGEELINNLGDVQSKADDLFELVREAKQSGQLSRIIGDVTAALNKLIDILVGATEFIYKYRVEIGNTVKAIIALKAVMKLSGTITNVIKVLGSLKSAMAALTTATQAQTAAQGALNASMAVNPYVLLITAVTALASAIGIKLVKSTIEADKAFLKMGKTEEVMHQAAQAADEFADSMMNSAKSRAENVSSIENEYDGYKNLAAQLFELTDKQEKSADDYKQINTLVDSLNQSMQGLGLSFDNTTGSLNMQQSELKKLIGDYENYYKTIALQESLTQLYQDQYEAEKKLTQAKEDQQKALESFQAAEQEVSIRTVLRYEDNGEEELNRARAQRDEAARTYQLAKQAADELSGTYDGISKEIAQSTKYISENAEASKDMAEKIADAYEEQTASAEELAESYKTAADAVKDYASALSGLVTLQKDISEGNEMSSLEMLDLIDKYPELAKQIRSAENGYTLEKEAIEELIKVKARNMELSAQEAAESKRALLQQAGLSSNAISILEQGFDNGMIKDIASLQAGRFTDDVREYLTAYAKEKGIGSIINDILQDGVKQGGQSTLDMASADSQFKALEHAHNMGRKSDEEYYNELEALNNKYYKNSRDNLDKYWSYEEKIYAYRKKAADDLAKAEEKSNAEIAKSLISLNDKINDVIDARNELNGIKNNKSVLAYDEATGFKLEADQNKLKNAYDKLSKAQDTLLIEKLGLGNNNSEIISSLKKMVSSLENTGIKNILPDLGKAYQQLGKISTTTNNNKTYNLSFGDVYTDGSKEDFESQLREFLGELIRKAERE